MTSKQVRKNTKRARKQRAARVGKQTTASVVPLWKLDPVGLDPRSPMMQSVSYRAVHGKREG